MHKSLFFISSLSLSLLFLFSGCSGETDKTVTDFELEHGIGPVNEVITLNEINPELAQRGKMIYDNLCIACHQMDAVVTAPRLRNTANNRSAAFILNYILNPEEMSQRHPVGRQLAGEYPGVKSRLGIEMEDALAVLEYLRLAAKGETD
ncbi:MAG: cytochrome c [Balneolaceae bacterium]|nr:MAG: cytochrome c [Balneolaceae bacterium]